MKYKEGNGVAEKSFVSIGEDNRRRLDELEARVATLEELCYGIVTKRERYTHMTKVRLEAE